jgi:hypothetical protein
MWLAEELIKLFLVVAMHKGTKKTYENQFYIVGVEEP